MRHFSSAGVPAMMLRVLAATRGAGNTLGRGPRTGAAAVALQPRWVAASEAQQWRRRVSTTLPRAKGRNDSAAHLKRSVKHWRQHISKKARRRHKRRLEREARHDDGEGTSALVVAQQRDAARVQAASAEERRRAGGTEKGNRFVIDVLQYKEPAPPSPQQALRAQDAAAMQRAIVKAGRAASVQQFNGLLRVLGAQGRFDDAMAAVEEMRRRGLSPDERTYTALMTLCARVRNGPAAWELLDVMKASGVEPTVVTYGALMQACIRYGDIAAAFRVLPLVEQDGLVPGPELFTHLIVACVRTNRLEQAWDTFYHMRTHHCEPDTVAFTAMLSACGRADEVERADSLLTEMKHSDVPLTHATYNSAIWAMGRSFRGAHRAHQLFDEMVAYGMAPDQRTYNSVLLACSHKGEVDRAREYMRRMAKDGLEPNLHTYTTLITVYARSMLQLSSKPGPLALDERADGANLLDPPVKKEVQPRIGDGVVVVEGNDDDVAQRLLLDYFNSDLKKDYNDVELPPIYNTDDEDEARHAAVAELDPEMAAEEASIEEYKAKAAKVLGVDSLDPSDSDSDIEALQGRLEAKVTELAAAGDTGEDHSLDGSVLNPLWGVAADDDSDAVLRELGVTLSELSDMDSDEAYSRIDDYLVKVGRASTLRDLQHAAEDREPLRARLSQALYSDSDDGEREDSDGDATDWAVGTIALPGKQMQGLVRRRRAGMATHDMVLEAKEKEAEAEEAREARRKYAALSSTRSADNDALGPVVGTADIGLDIDAKELTMQHLRDLPADKARKLRAEMEDFLWAPRPKLVTAEADARAATTSEASARRRAPAAVVGETEAGVLVRTLKDVADGKIADGDSGRDAASGAAAESSEDAPSITDLVLGAVDAKEVSTTERREGADRGLSQAARSHIANSVLAGAEWLPRELPDDPNRARNALVDEALGIYARVQEQGMTPDAVCLNTVVLTLAEARRERDVLEFMQTEFPKHAVAPTERTYRALVRMYVQTRRVDTAAQVVAAMRASGLPPSRDTMGWLVHGYAASRKLDKAFRVLEEMEAAGLRCSEHYGFLLRQRCKEMRVWHPLVPQSPVAWQFSEKAIKARKATGKHINSFRNEIKSKTFQHARSVPA